MKIGNKNIDSECSQDNKTANERMVVAKATMSRKVGMSSSFGTQLILIHDAYNFWLCGGTWQTPFTAVKEKKT